MTYVPQVRFLRVIVDEAQRCPAFRLVMGGRVEALLQGDDGQVRGVRYRARDGWHEVRAQLVVAADGRFSRVRSLAGLEPVRTAAAFDVLWFRLPRRETDPPPGVFVSNGGWTVLHNRGTEWQVGCTIAKGSYPRVRAQGLAAVSAGRPTSALAGRPYGRPARLEPGFHAGGRVVTTSALVSAWPAADRGRRAYDVSHRRGRHHRGDPGRRRGGQCPRAAPAGWTCEGNGPGGRAAPPRVAGGASSRPTSSGCKIG